MTRRKVRDRAEAVALLDGLSASGQSLAGFCRVRGIDGRSLNCWRYNVQDGTPRAPVGLRLVELAAPVPLPPAVYRVVLDGIEVEVDDQFCDDTLARLLAVVSAC